MSELAKFRKLFNNSIIGSVISLSRLSSGFVRGKVTAIALGVAGVGIFSQGNQLALFGLTIASLSMASGIVNRLNVGENHADEVAQGKVISTAFTLQFFLCLLTILMGVLFSGPLSRAVFASTEYQGKVLLVFASIPFSVFASGYLQCFLVHPDRYKRMMWATVGANFSGLIVFIVLVKKYALLGAFIGMGANSLLLFLFYLFAIPKGFGGRSLFGFGFDRSEFLFLIKFAALGLVMAAVSYGANLWIRGVVLMKLGSVENGLLQVPIAMTSYYSPFLVDAFWIQLYPAVSKAGDTSQSRKELFTVLKYVITLQTFIALILLLFQNYFIKIAYSSSFLDANKLIPIELVGDFFYFILQGFSIYFMGVLRLRQSIVGWSLYYGILIVTTLIGISQYGVRAVPAAYAIVSFLFTLVLMAWAWNQCRDEVRAIRGYVALCFLLVFGGALLANQEMWIPQLGLLLFFIAYAITHTVKVGRVK